MPTSNDRKNVPGPDCLDQRRDAEDVDYTGETVSKDRERGVGAGIFQPLHQKVRRAKVYLDRAERMLGRLTTLATANKPNLRQGSTSCEQALRIASLLSFLKSATVL